MNELWWSLGGGVILLTLWLGFVKYAEVIGKVSWQAGWREGYKQRRLDEQACKNSEYQRGVLDGARRIADLIQDKVAEIEEGENDEEDAADDAAS